MNNRWWYKMNEKNEQRENVRMARRQQQKKEFRIRMLKVGSAVAVVLLLVSAVTGLYLHNKNNTSVKSTDISKTSKKKEVMSTETSKTKETMESTQSSTEGTLEEQLQTILTTYSKKIENQTPVLIEEYQTEIQKNQDGLTGLSNVANQKARALQAISDEGIRKLREKYQTAHAKAGVDLDTMINQLSAIYTAQVARISDIYLRTSASLKVDPSTSQETSETNATIQTTESTTESQMSAEQYAQGTSSSQSASQSTSAATTVVREGEGPNQIAERTGVPVETILSLNGMTMDDYFLHPGEVLKLN